VDEQNRRELLKLPLAAGALTLAARADAQAQARSAGKQRKTIDEFDSANIKLAHRVSIRASDDDLLFLKQIGLRYIRAEIPLDAKLEELAPARDRFAKAGISIISCAHYAHRSLNIGLARPGPERDRDIETCQAVVRELGRLGVSILVLDWHPGNVYTSQNVDTPRGYKAREFSVSDFQSRQEKQLFGREYPAEEIWDGFVYWLKAVLPVAEEANVKLAMHPDDPPVLKKMNGIGRIFTNEECYRRAEQVAGKSRHWGVRLCVGTWAEGGDQMGKSVLEMIRDYGGRGKIFDMDFRNVSSTLPRFHETFPDEGYLNLYQVMKALRQVRYSGPMVPDHIPPLVGDTGVGRGGLGYCIGFMRALLRAANEEVG
jgi:mannonate dehydratase